MRTLIDQATRSQTLAADPHASVWVGANAGTGKTKVLTDRLLNLLLMGTAPDRILCLTFTKAAAAEMATRLADRLSGWAVMPDAALDRQLVALGTPTGTAQRAAARRLFARLLDVPGGMRIETIHAFCQGLLRRFPLEAGVSPHFDVLGDRDAADLMGQAYERLLIRVRQEGTGPLAQALSVVTANVHETKFSALMRQLTAQRGRLRRLLDRHGSDLAMRQALFERMGVPLDWSEAQMRQQAVAQLDRDSVRCLAQALSRGGKTDQKVAQALADWLALDGTEQVDQWALISGSLLTQKGAPRSASTFPCKAVKQASPDVIPLVESLNDAVLLVEEQAKKARVAEASAALMTLGHALLEDYAHAKDQRALLDYDDLILAARRLLSDSAGAAWVLYKLDGGLEHIMIDEAQDTSPDQWEVVARLSEEFFSGEGTHPHGARTIFVVGDRKQSIYSFQGADPVAFDRMRQSYAQTIPAAGLPFRDVALDVSFRSVPAVLEVVDHVFSQSPAHVGVRTQQDGRDHLAARQGMAGMVEMWPPMPTQALDPGAPWKPPVEVVRGESAQTRLARLLACRIAAMVGKERLESQNRLLRAGDIMVLVRRRTGFVEDLVRALKGKNVPVAGADRMVLVNQMVVMDLLALGDILLLPEDSLTLACVLKSPLFGFDEDQLRRIAHGRPHGVSLWRALREAADGSDEVARVYRSAYQILRDLMEKADFLPPHEVFAHVLGPLAGRHKLLARLGPDAADPLDEFVQLTLTYDRGHPPSMQGFLHWIRADDGTLKRDLEDGLNAVRVMTVHGSKGLQAPVVILPDTRSVPSTLDAVLWDEDAGVMVWPPRAADREDYATALYETQKQAQMDEYHRLLYVALTRAEDRLIVCGWDGQKAAPPNNWYDLVAASVQTLGSESEDPFLFREGPALGLDETRVWRLTQSQQVPPHCTASSESDDSPIGMKTVPAWTRRPPPSEPSPPRPLTPSRVEVPDPPVRSPRDDRPESRTQSPHRFRRGVLIHRLLQQLPEVPADRWEEAARTFLARPVWELSTPQQEALTREILAVLRDQTLCTLFSADSLAEAPISGLVGAHGVSGQVDRLVVTAQDVLIIDYKTNRPPPTRVEDVAAAYVVQMALYRAVLQGIYPGRQVRCALLWTDGPRLMELPSDMLEQELRKRGVNIAASA